MSVPGDDISIERTGAGMTVKAPLVQRAAHRSRLPAVGVALGFVATLWSLRMHSVVGETLFFVLDAFAAYLVVALRYGRSVAVVDARSVVIRQNFGLPGARRCGRLSSIAYGRTSNVTRYGNSARYPVVARFDDNRFEYVIGDAGDLANGERCARTIATALALPVETSLPHRSSRDVARLTIVITTALLAPIAALLIWLFVSTHVPHHHHAR